MKTYLTLMSFTALLVLSGCGGESTKDPVMEDDAIAAEDLMNEVGSSTEAVEPAFEESVTKRRLENIAPTAEFEVAGPKVIAAIIHADWCAKCRELDPKVKAMQAANPFDDLEFVTLDYTAKNDAAFFEAADAAGVGEAIRSALIDGVKTGQVILVDVDDKTSLGKISSDMDNASIVATLKTAIDAA